MLGDERIGTCEACNQFKLIKHKEAWVRLIWLCNSCFWHLTRVETPFKNLTEIQEWAEQRRRKVNGEK